MNHELRALWIKCDVIKQYESEVGFTHAFFQSELNPLNPNHHLHQYTSLHISVPCTQRAGIPASGMVRQKPVVPVYRLMYYQMQTVLLKLDTLRLIGQPQFNGQMLFVLTGQWIYGSVFATAIGFWHPTWLFICTRNIWDYEDLDTVNSDYLDDFCCRNLMLKIWVM